jgi:hypothetical protein
MSALQNNGHSSEPKDVEETIRISADSDVFKFYENGSRILFVWFGGIREPFFGKSFAEQSGFDCLYLRDAAFDWYTNGIVGLVDDVYQSVNWLKGFMSEKYDFVCFGGQSSGGYAALHYGLLCNANLCVVFAPQTRNTFDGQCRMSPDVRLVDLYEIYSESLQPPKVVLNVSRSESEHVNEFMWDDFRQIETFRTLNCVTTIIHPYDHHATSFKLHDDGMLYGFLSSTVDLYGALAGVAPVPKPDPVPA